MGACGWARSMSMVNWRLANPSSIFAFVMASCSAFAALAASDVAQLVWSMSTIKNRKAQHPARHIHCCFSLFIVVGFSVLMVVVGKYSIFSLCRQIIHMKKQEGFRFVANICVFLQVNVTQSDLTQQVWFYVLKAENG